MKLFLYVSYSFNKPFTNVTRETHPLHKKLFYAEQHKEKLYRKLTVSLVPSKKNDILRV